MSDHIGHIGICDDTFRLAMRDDRIHPVFRELMASHREDSHLGSVTRQADKWSADVIDASAERLRSGPDDAMAKRKLAFVLGSLTHRAADRLTKPITKLEGEVPGWDNNESKIMQDLLVFREVFLEGKDEGDTLFSPDCIGPWDDAAMTRFEAVFRLMLRRQLIAMHTLNPDSANVDAWLENLFAGLQTFPKSLELYARLAREWPQEKVDRYLVSKNFYRREDPILLLARRIQNGFAATAEEVAGAHAATRDDHSRYARALAKALEYLMAAGELFGGRIDVEEAKVRFDVGVPELSLKD